MEDKPLQFPEHLLSYQPQDGELWYDYDSFPPPLIPPSPSDTSIVFVVKTNPLNS